MGCGSSKAAVSVIDTDNKPENSTTTKAFPTPTKTPSLEHFQAKSSKTSLQKSNNNADKSSQPPSASPSVTSIIDLNNNKNKTISNRQNSSERSLKDIRKPSTACSSKSGDSGVYEDPERSSSAKSRQSNISGIL